MPLPQPRVSANPDEELAVLRRQLHVAVETQTALADFSRKLLAATDAPTLADEAVAVAARLLHADYSLLVLPDPSGRLIIQAVRGWPPAFAGQFESPAGHQSQIGYTLQTGA